MTNLRWAFTIIPENIEHFGKVYDDAIKRGIQFTHSFAQSSDNFFGGKHIDNHPNAKILREQYEHIIAGELKSWNFKRWARAYYAYSLYNFIIKREQPLNNDPGNRFFFLHSDGTVFPSVVHNYPMGNLLQVKNWSELWQSKMANGARELVKTEGVPAWMICTARTAIKKHPFKVGWWVLKNKIRLNMK
jgi:MoaA/NifB/PqqE/SkfB family radical SAM enzyme